MAVSFVWGCWEEEWLSGRFRCVFVEAEPQPDGMIHAAGLYRAIPGESFDDLDTYQDQIAERAVVTIDGNGELLVRNEFAELMGTLPVFLQEASRRLNRIDRHLGRRHAGCASQIAP
jgi:hypothetical protein